MPRTVGLRSDVWFLMSGFCFVVSVSCFPLPASRFPLSAVVVVGGGGGGDEQAGRLCVLLLSALALMAHQAQDPEDGTGWLGWRLAAGVWQRASDEAWVQHRRGRWERGWAGVAESRDVSPTRTAPVTLLPLLSPAARIPPIPLLCGRLCSCLPTTARHFCSRTVALRQLPIASVHMAASLPWPGNANRAPWIHIPVTLNLHGTTTITLLASTTPGGCKAKRYLVQEQFK